MEYYRQIKITSFIDWFGYPNLAWQITSVRFSAGIPSLSQNHSKNDPYQSGVWLLSHLYKIVAGLLDLALGYL